MQSRLPRKDQLAYQAHQISVTGDREAAIRAWEAVLAEYPRDSVARMWLVMTLEDENQVERVVAVLQDGLRLDPNDHPLLNLLCYAYARMGDLAAALKTNERYRSLLPADPNPWDTRGDVLYLLGRDDEAIAAYNKVLELRPDFGAHTDLVKLAFVYMDRKRYAQAESALQEYGRRSKDLGLAIYQGRLETAGNALGALARNSLFLGTTAEALAFARQQNLKGEETQAVALLEAARGDMGGMERSIGEYAATCPWLGPRAFDLFRSVCAMTSALMKNDGQGALAAAGRVPDYRYSGFLLMRGRGELLAKDYAAAERSFRRAILDTRDLSTPAGLPTRSPLVEMLCHFHLGQVHEATGKRDQAISEYREFLSRFEGSPTRLPQVAEARAALKRLGAS